MKRQVTDFDVDTIQPNRRLQCSNESIQSMCRSIRSGLAVEPISIRFTGERFVITDGELRWRACKCLGVKRIQVIIDED